MKIRLVLFGAVTALLTIAPVRVAAEVGAETVPAEEELSSEQVDAIHILPISSIALGDKVECLVFVPGGLDRDGPVPALIVFPDDLERVDTLDEFWSGGDVPKSDNMIIVVPRIDPNLPEELVFSLFSEVMFAGNETYRLDQERIYLWGVGPAARHAYFAARALPEKFAAVVDFPEDIFHSGSLLDFALLDTALQLEAVRADTATYRENLRRIGMVHDDRGVGSIAEIEPGYWGEIAASLLRHKSNGNVNGVSYRTDRLRFNKHSLVQIVNFQNWSLPAGVRADIQSEGERLVCRTENVATISIAIPEKIEKIEIDGERFSVEPSRTYTYQLRRRWREIGPPAVVVTRKNPDCAGPLADALITPFVFVVGTQGENEEALRAWAALTAKDIGFPKVRIVTDQEVMDDEDLQRNYTLICFGGAENLVAAKIATRDKPGAGVAPTSRDLVHTCLRPSPFAIDRYLVINEALGDGAMQGPARLRWYSDWSVYRSSTGAPVALGSFDGDWRPEDIPEDPWEDFRR